VKSALRRLDGVRSVDARPLSRVATIEPASDAAVDLGAIAGAMWGEGFRAAEVRLVARGTFDGEGDRAGFRIAGWTRVLPLAAAPTPLPSGPARIEAVLDDKGGALRLVRGSVLGPG